MSTTFDRRAFLVRSGLAGAGAVALAAGVPRPAAAQDAGLAPFFHGVASGEPLADGIVLWTRVTPEDASGAAVPVTWTIATDLELTDVVGTGTVDATADEDFTVHVDVDGLQPWTYYFYVFEAYGKRSIIGRTKTAPSAAEADRLRFGVVSCSNYEGGYFNAYARLAERNDIDAVLALGDYVYEYGQGGYGPGEEIGRVTQPAEEMSTLEGYRGRYAHYRLDPDLRRLHQLFPFINTWDDHESTNDSWRGGAENHNDGEGDWEERKATSQRVWKEWLPTRVPDPSKIWRSFRYGDLADLVWLDTRLERDQPAGGVLDPSNAFNTEIDDPDRVMISPEQKAFLYDAMSTSKADGVTWRILCQQVMLMQWNATPVPSSIQGNDFPTFGTTAGGYRANPDAWDGYTAERSNFFAHLRDNDIDNLVVLTGDIHSCWAADLTEDPFDITSYDPTGVNPLISRRNLGVEFVGSSVTSDNIDEIVLEQGGTRQMGIAGAIAIEEGSKAVNPHIKMVELRSHGYFVLDITAERTQSDFYFTPILEPSPDESHFQSWYTDVDAHRVQQGTELAARDAGPAVPGGEPAPAPTPTETPTETAAPTEELPATGGGAGVAAVAVGAAALLRLRGRGGDA